MPSAPTGQARGPAPTTTALGVFIRPDDIVQDWYDPQSLNRFAYCRNNPLIYVDPTGHATVAEFIEYKAVTAGEQGSTWRLATWATASAVWAVFGSEEVSKVTDCAITNRGDLTAGDIAWAALDVGTAGKGGKLKGVIKTGEKFVVVKKTADEAIEVGTDVGKVAKKKTSRQARRDAMRENNTPTTRSADSQTGSGNNRQYVTEGSDGKPRVQTHHTADKNHTKDHWHDAEPKTDESGNLLRNRHGQVKYKKSGSSSVDHD